MYRQTMSTRTDNFTYDVMTSLPNFVVSRLLLVQTNHVEICLTRTVQANHVEICLTRTVQANHIEI